MPDVVIRYHSLRSPWWCSWAMCPMWSVPENTSVYLSGIEIRSNGRAKYRPHDEDGFTGNACWLAIVFCGDDDPLEGAGMWCVDSAVRIQKSMLIGNSMRRRRVKPGGALALH